MTVTLPQQFQDTMRELLAEEYQDYIKSMEEPSHTALRVNTHKISLTEFAELCPFASEPVAWEPKGFYYDSTGAAVSKHPYYYAGLYYIQEPSAFSAIASENGDAAVFWICVPHREERQRSLRQSWTEAVFWWRMISAFPEQWRLPRIFRWQEPRMRL